MKKKDELQIYRTYVADSLYAQGHNLAFTRKYSDIIEKTPEKSGDEIVVEFITKLMKGGNDN